MFIDCEQYQIPRLSERTFTTNAVTMMNTKLTVNMREGCLATEMIYLISPIKSIICQLWNLVINYIAAVKRE